MKYYVILLALAVCASSAWLLNIDAHPDTHDLTGHIFKMEYISQSLAKDNTVHKWLDHWFMGVPFLHYYPPLYYELIGYSSFFLYIPVEIVMRLGIVLVYFFSGVSMYYLSSLFTKKEKIRVLTAAIYAFCTWHTTVINQQGNFPHTLTFALIPIILYYFERMTSSKKKQGEHYAILAGIATGITVLIHHATAYLLLPTMLIFWLFNLKKLRLKQLLILGFVIVFTCSFWVLPFMRDIKYSALGIKEGLTYDINEMNRGSINPFFLLLPWKGFNPLSKAGGLNFYMSIITLILACVGALKFRRKVPFYIFLAVFFYSLTFGVYLPLGPLKELFLRGISPIQFPFRFLTIAVIGLSILAGKGFEALLKRKRLFYVLVLLLFLDLSFNAWSVWWKDYTSYPFLSDVTIADRTDLFGGNSLSIRQLRGFWEGANPIISVSAWDLSSASIEHNYENIYGLARVDYVITKEQEFNKTFEKYGDYYAYPVRPFPRVIGSDNYEIVYADSIREAYKDCFFNPLISGMSANLSRKLFAYTDNEEEATFKCNADVLDESFFNSDDASVISLKNYEAVYPGKIIFNFEAPEKAMIQTSTPYYPFWEVVDNEEVIPTFQSVNGMLSFNVDEGEHNTVMKFKYPIIDYALLVLFFISALIFLKLILKQGFTNTVVGLFLMLLTSQASVLFSIIVLLVLFFYNCKNLKSGEAPTKILLFLVLFSCLRNFVWYF